MRINVWMSGAEILPRVHHQKSEADNHSDPSQKFGAADAQSESGNGLDWEADLGQGVDAVRSILARLDRVLAVGESLCGLGACVSLRPQ